MTAKSTTWSFRRSRVALSMKASRSPSFRFFGFMICSILGMSGRSRTTPVDRALASIPRTVV